MLKFVESVLWYLEADTYSPGLPTGRDTGSTNESDLELLQFSFSYRKLIKPAVKSLLAREIAHL